MATGCSRSFTEYQPDDDIGYTYIPVPADGDESHTMAGGWSGVVPQGPRIRKAATSSSSTSAEPDGSRTYVQMNNNLPVLHELLADASLFTEDLKWFVDNLFPATEFRPPLPVGAKYWDELEAGWEAIRLNLSDPATAMAQVKDNTMAELEAGGYCPIAAPPSSEATPAS